MGIRGLATVAVWVVALLLGLNATRMLVSRLLARSRSNEVSASVGPIRVTPYTVLFDLRDPRRSETARRTVVKLVALRTDGSFVQQLEVLDGRMPVSSRLIQLASGTTITTNDILERKYTREVNVAMPSKLRDPRSRCLATFAGTPFMPGEQIVGEDVVAGYKTVRMKNRDATLWFAPDLGCAELRSRIVHPSGEVIDRTVTTVTAGEPNPSLFDVGAQYTEVPRERLAGR